MGRYSHITINNRKIGQDFSPYLIAEMSANHNGEIEKAFKIIEAAKESGADAVKIQTYHPDTITLNSQSADFKILGGKWDGRYLYDLYKEAHLPWDWHKPLFDYAKKIGITIFSSPFDSTAVDLLEDLNTPAYKIASFEAIDLPLIKYVAQTKKPMIISTGMCNLEEIGEAIEAAYSGGCKQIAILHCVSGYPAPAEEYNLFTIPKLIEYFKLVTGLSDHTINNVTAITSIALGASIIEKHFTLDKNGGGPDDSFSLEKIEMKQLCKDIKISWSSLGTISHNLSPSEKNNIQFRRSLYFLKDLKAGDIITLNDIKSVRPGYGMAPKFFNEIVGKKILKNVKAYTPVLSNLIEVDN